MFGDVRSWMAMGPVEAWAALVEGAPRYHDAQEWREVVVPYIEGVKATWPGRGGFWWAEPSWLDVRGRTGRWHPLMGLCDGLRLPPEHVSPGRFHALVEGGMSSWDVLVVEETWSDRLLGAIGEVEGLEVRCLHLEGCQNVLRVLEALSVCDWFHEVERLVVSRGFMSEDGQLNLGRRPNTTLRTLKLDLCGGGGTWGLRELVRYGWFEGVIGLDVGIKLPVGPRIWASYVSAEARIRATRTRSDWINTTALADAFELGMPRLARLGLSDVFPSWDMFDALDGRLAFLEMSGRVVKDEYVEALLEEGVLEHLVRLDVGGSWLTPSGLDMLARERWPELEALRVWPQEGWSVEGAREYAMRPEWSEGVREGMLADLVGVGVGEG